MTEWLKVHAWKACVGETLPRVRIPLSPPFESSARDRPSDPSRWTMTTRSEIRLPIPPVSNRITAAARTHPMLPSDRLAAQRSRTLSKPADAEGVSIRVLVPDSGEVPEWSNGAVSKTVDGASRPWVRIPPSPPAFCSFNPCRVKSFPFPKPPPPPGLSTSPGIPGGFPSPSTQPSEAPNHREKVDSRETYIPAEQSPPQEEAWFPPPHADSPWSGHPGAPASQGSQAPERLSMDGSGPFCDASRSDERLRPDHRLARRSDFLSCYRRGRRRHGTLATIHHHPTPSGAPLSRAGAEARLGITVSRKVAKKAVVRHRVKRRIREIFRRWPHRRELGAVDLVVHVKPSAARASFAELDEEIRRLLSTLVRGPSP